MFDNQNPTATTQHGGVIMIKVCFINHALALHAAEGKMTLRRASTNKESIIQLSVTATDLVSSQGCLLQDRAYMSFSASEAMVAFLYMDQAKSHSSTPPAAIALQYTVDFKLGLILERLIKMIESYDSSEGIREVKWKEVDKGPKAWEQNTRIKVKQLLHLTKLGFDIIIPGWKKTTTGRRLCQ